MHALYFASMFYFLSSVFRTKWSGCNFRSLLLNCKILLKIAWSFIKSIWKWVCEHLFAGHLLIVFICTIFFSLFLFSIYFIFIFCTCSCRCGYKILLHILWRQMAATKMNEIVKFWHAGQPQPQPHQAELITSTQKPDTPQTNSVQKLSPLPLSNSPYFPSFSVSNPLAHTMPWSYLSSDVAWICE